MSDWRKDIIIDKEEGIITKASPTARGEYPRMTNYERIKSMTIEEMAEFLCDYCKVCKLKEGQTCNSTGCTQGTIQYLESESEVEE